jgi:dimethylaniline monooxygenase (N-oxide forming)
MSSLPTSCVIGAGSSGIAAVKALNERGFDVVAYDKSDRVGGNWVWGNSNRMSSAYRSLHINTSRERMEYTDFPMPKSYPDFPHHTHIARYFAARRGAHIVPKYLFGRPMDQLGASTKIPFEVRRKMFQAMLRAYVGDVERYGLPRPDHRFGDAHPTVSDDILSRMAHGTISAKPNIAALTRDSVRFADGSEVKADIVIYCTGYKVTFPFFDEGFISAPDNDLPLFRRTFHPDIRNVFFIGLLQPLGAIMPIAEHQSTWVADYLSGRYALPGDRELRADIARERERMFKRYVASKRHTMQVDFDDFLAALAKERKRGAERARLAGQRLPVPPRAAAVAAA